MGRESVSFCNIASMENEGIQKPQRLSTRIDRVSLEV